jgi:hypothetical protein
MRALFILCLCLFACSSVPLTPEGERVRVVQKRAALGKNCRLMGQLAPGSDKSGDSIRLALHDTDASHRLRNMAAERGDTVFIDKAAAPGYQAYVLRCHGLPKHTASLAPEAAPVAE